MVALIDSKGRIIVHSGGVFRATVTLLWGWTQETVGKVIGVESIGDLAKHTGETVGVYANKLRDGSYTLYGNADYYIDLK